MIGRARRHVNGQAAKSAQALLWRRRDPVARRLPIAPRLGVCQRDTFSRKNEACMRARMSVVVAMALGVLTLATRDAYLLIQGEYIQRRELRTREVPG